MGVGDAGVDLLDTADGEDVAGGRTRELVSAVRGTDGDGEGVDLGLLDKVGGLFRIGQQLAVIQGAFGADAVFFAGLAWRGRARARRGAGGGRAAGGRRRGGAAGDV